MIELSDQDREKQRAELALLRARRGNWFPGWIMFLAGLLTGVGLERFHHSGDSDAWRPERQEKQARKVAPG